MLACQIRCVFRSFYWMCLEENKVWGQFSIIPRLSCSITEVCWGMGEFSEKKLQVECRCICCLCTFPSSLTGSWWFPYIKKKKSRRHELFVGICGFNLIQVPLLHNKQITWQIKSRHYIQKYLTFSLSIN